VAEEEAVAPVSSGLLKRLATKPPRVEAEPASIVSKPEPKPERPTKAEPVAAKKVEPVAANESIEPETGAPEKKVAARIALPLAAAGFAIAVAAAAVSVMRSQPPEAPSSVAAAPVAPRLSTAVVTQPPVAPEEAAPAVVEEAPKLVKTNRPKRVQAETSSPETADIPF
jgi:hypothetical protein